MTIIDLTNLSAHAIVDRKVRINIIEKTVGFGNPVCEADDIKEQDCKAVLTDTGVIVILNPDGMIITTWVASVPQAIAVWRRATRKKQMPKDLWKMVNYNNNTTLWHKMAA